MDVSADLAAHAARVAEAQRINESSNVVVDTALLAAFDEAPTDDPEYATDLESYLLTRSTATTQALLAALFSLPTVKDASLGPLAKLPSPPITKLPREKRLPKPKPPTTWERFAAAKGISHKKREKDVWDEERQAFVPRWGRDGKNKETEEAWIRVIKGGDDADHDPIVKLRKERKDRVDKNQRQQERNQAQAAQTTQAAKQRTGVSTLSQHQKKELRDSRKKELERSMLISKTATASMGKFDKKIEGEPKVKGIKRKFAPNAAPSFAGERESAMSILSGIGKPAAAATAAKKGSEGREGDVNVRKAVRFNERMDRLKKGGKKN